MKNRKGKFCSQLLLLNFFSQSFKMRLRNLVIAIMYKYKIYLFHSKYLTCYETKHAFEHTLDSDFVLITTKQCKQTDHKSCIITSTLSFI